VLLTDAKGGTRIEDRDRRSRGGIAGAALLTALPPAWGVVGWVEGVVVLGVP